MDLENEGGKPAEDVTIDPNAGQPAAAQVAQQEPGLQVEEIEDIDDIELRSALADVGAEEPEGQSQPAPDETDPTLTPPAAAKEPGTNTPEPKSAPVMIAKPRFDEVLDRAKRAETHLATSSAENIALKQRLAQYETPAQNPDIVAIDALIDELAQKFDEGTITYKDMKAQERQLQTRRDQLREEEIVQRATARAVESVPKAPSGNDGWLAEQTAQVQTEFGAYVDAIPVHMFNTVVEHVRSDLTAKGTDLRGDRGSAILRKAVGEYAKQEHAFFARASGIAPITSNAPAPQRVVPGNQPTADQRRAKLELQNSMPPDLSGMARSIGSDTMLTEAQIEEMDEEDIAALPVATKNRLLGYS